MLFYCNKEVSLDKSYKDFLQDSGSKVKDDHSLTEYDPEFDFPSDVEMNHIYATYKGIVDEDFS